MKRQTSFAEAESTGKKRVTKRQCFLTEMERVVPRPQLLSAIEPYYPKGAWACFVSGRFRTPNGESFVIDGRAYPHRDGRDRPVMSATGTR